MDALAAILAALALWAAALLTLMASRRGNEGSIAASFKSKTAGAGTPADAGH